MQLNGVNASAFMASMQQTFTRTVAQYYNVTEEKVIIDSVVDVVGRRRRLVAVTLRRLLAQRAALIVRFRCLVDSTEAVEKSLELHEAVTTGAFTDKLQEMGAAMQVVVTISASFTSSPKITAEDPNEVLHLSDVIAQKYPPQDTVVEAKKSNSLWVFIIVAVVAAVAVLLGIAYMVKGTKSSNEKQKMKMKKIYMETDEQSPHDSKPREKEEEKEEVAKDSASSSPNYKLARVAALDDWGPPAHIVEEAFTMKSDEEEATAVLGPPMGLLPELPPLLQQGFLPPIIDDDDDGAEVDVDFVLGPPDWLRGEIEVENDPDPGVWES
jgi:hypothetical protein